MTVNLKCSECGSENVLPCECGQNNMCQDCGAPIQQ